MSPLPQNVEFHTTKGHILRADAAFYTTKGDIRRADAAFYTTKGDNAPSLANFDTSSPSKNRGRRTRTRHSRACLLAKRQRPFFPEEVPKTCDFGCRILFSW